MSIRAETKDGQKTGRWIAEPRNAPHRAKKTFLTKAEAQEWHAFMLAKFREYKRRESLGQIVKDYTFPEAINKWMEDHYKESAKFHLRTVVREMGDTLLIDVPKKAKEWKARMLAEEMAPSTINKKMAIIDSVLKFAYQEDLIERPVHGKIKKLQQNNAREVFLTDSEIVKLCAEIKDEEARKAVIIVCYTGLRRGELLKLKREDVNNELQVIELKGSITKSGKPRFVPYPDFLAPILETLPLKITARKIRYWFEKAREAAKLEHVHFHDLRHTYASMLQEQDGYSEFLGMEILGHSTVNMTNRYTHARNHDIKKRLVDNMKAPDEITRLLEGE